MSNVGFGSLAALLLNTRRMSAFGQMQTLPNRPLLLMFLSSYLVFSATEIARHIPPGKQQETPNRISSKLDRGDQLAVDPLVAGVIAHQ
jgi:hypothetical protein